MHKKFLAIMGIVLMGASAYVLNHVEVQSNVAGADENTTTVSITCANGGTTGYTPASMAGTATIGHARGGPKESCEMGSLSLISGLESQVAGHLQWHCTHTGANILGYITAPKIAVDLTCSGNSKVALSVYGSASGQDVALAARGSNTQGVGSGRFDNISAANSAVVIWGSSGIMGAAVTDGSAYDNQAGGKQTDQFVVINGWYLGFQIPADSTGTKDSVMNLVQTPGT